LREERLHELAARQNRKRQDSIKSVMKKWALTARPFALSPFLHARPNPLKQAIVCAIIYINFYINSDSGVQNRGFGIAGFAQI
jgi:hypothetical protein